MYDNFEDNVTIYDKCNYCVIILSDFKEKYKLSDKKMTELIKKYDLCQFIGDNILEFDSGGLQDGLNYVKEYIEKRGGIIDNSVTKFSIEGNTKIDRHERIDASLKVTLEEQTSMLMEHLVNKGMGLTEAYIKLKSTETLKVLLDTKTEIFNRSNEALKYLLDLELSGDMDAWFREAFL